MGQHINQHSGVNRRSVGSSPTWGWGGNSRQIMPLMLAVLRQNFNETVAKRFGPRS